MNMGLFGGFYFTAGFCKIKFHWINFLLQLTEFKCVSFRISMVSDSLSEFKLQKLLARAN